MHHDCTGGKGSDDGIADADADALAIAVETEVAVSELALDATLDAGAALLLINWGTAPTAWRRANNLATWASILGNEEASAPKWLVGRARSSEKFRPSESFAPMTARRSAPGRFPPGGAGAWISSA